jgi:hypothetical protein
MLMLNGRPVHAVKVADQTKTVTDAQVVTDAKVTSIVDGYYLRSDGKPVVRGVARPRTVIEVKEVTSVKTAEVRDAAEPKPAAPVKEQ